MANRNVGADDHEGAVLQRCARDGSSGAAAKRQIRLCIKPPTDGRVQACKDGKGFLSVDQLDQPSRVVFAESDAPFVRLKWLF
jgi:hypothetical protein